MGLSRNKVAVSEGAAGSPPFYGDHEEFSRIPRSRNDEMWSTAYGDFCCSIFEDQKRSLKVKEQTRKRGCSSAGRAPALQAGGHGFEPHHLHQSKEFDTQTWEDGNERGRLKERSVAQVVRAHA